MNEFHPNELDPYLLFDARDSMIGTLENPTLDLDPSQPDTLNVITATRAGVATFTDVNGLIASAPENTVRVDYVDSVPMILVEPSATNLLPYSEDFSNAAWTKFGGGTGVAPTVTPNYGTSPDGTVSASRVQFNKGSGTTVGDQSTLFDSAATSSGATTAKSVYLKSNTTEAYEMVIYEVTNASGTNVKKITVTPDWQRFDVYGSISSTTTGISIGLREISVSGLSNTADVLVWGAQVEAGSVATSYIPTSGGDAAARTRAADDLVISGSAFSDFFNGSEGTFYIEAVDKDVSGGAHAYVAGQTTSQFFFYKNDSNTSINSYDGVNGLFHSGLVSNQLFRAAVSYNSSVKSLSFNGATSSGNHRATGGFSDTNILKIGSGYTNVFSGHYRRILYWPYHSDNL